MIWLFNQRGREDPIGDLARHAFGDPEWGGTMSSLRKRIDEEHMKSFHIDCTKAMDIFKDSQEEFRAQRKKY